jgi:hypothetical protein
MKEHIFVANTYQSAKYNLDEFVGNFYVKDWVKTRTNPTRYYFSGENVYSCTTVNSPVSLRGKVFETIYLCGELDKEFMNAVRKLLPVLHFKKIYYYNCNNGKVENVYFIGGKFG